jgi:hypothetical protein
LSPKREKEDMDFKPNFKTETLMPRLIAGEKIAIDSQQSEVECEGGDSDEEYTPASEKISKKSSPMKRSPLKSSGFAGEKSTPIKSTPSKSSPLKSSGFVGEKVTPKKIKHNITLKEDIRDTAAEFLNAMPMALKQDLVFENKKETVEELNAERHALRDEAERMAATGGE